MTDMDVSWTCLYQPGSNNVLPLPYSAFNYSDSHLPEPIFFSEPIFNSTFFFKELGKAAYIIFNFCFLLKSPKASEEAPEILPPA